MTRCKGLRVVFDCVPMVTSDSSNQAGHVTRRDLKVTIEGLPAKKGQFLSGS